MTVPRVFAAIGLGLAIAGAIGTAVVRIVAPAPFIPVPFGFSEAAMVGFLIEGLTWASIGALLVVRRPENAVGWLMVVVGVGNALSMLCVAITFAFADQGTADGVRLAQIAGWATVLFQLVGIFQFAIAFVFPTGRAQSQGWARFMRVFWTFAIAFVVISLIQPGSLQLVPSLQNPFGLGPDLRGDQPVAPLLAVFALVVFPALGMSMAGRYRAAGHIEREQLKWFLLASGLSAIGLGIVFWEAVIMGRSANAIGLTVYAFAGALVPVAIGIAILRHHLYDIDRLISRTLSYGLITGVLAAVFAVVIVGVGHLLTSFTRGIIPESQGEMIAVAVSTLVVFALFQPVRSRVQRVVDRHFDRGRYDGQQTLAAFAGRLRSDVDLASISADVARTAGAAVHPASATVWLRAIRGRRA